MAGTIPISMTTQFDIYGKPLSGGRLYGMQAGSVSTPQNFYQDVALSIAWPNPIVLDAGGRIPQLFCSDGEIKIRLEDKNGVVQLAADHVLVIGPSSGGGGGSSSVDATTVAQTGDMKARYGTGAHPGVTPGWVRANGLTIGSSGSSASERANADCQNLFQYLWNTDSSLAVSSGRGGSASADWGANKQLTLPDWRGYALGALADMGNTPTTVLTSTYFGSSPTVLGAVGGSQVTAIVNVNLPAHTHSGTTNTDTPDHTHSYLVASSSGSQKPTGTGSAPLDTVSGAQTGGASARHTHTFITDGGPGSGVGFTNVTPLKLATIYLKL
jgi:hypothetical protein